jgi:hypothetical protein
VPDAPQVASPANDPVSAVAEAMWQAASYEDDTWLDRIRRRAEMRQMRGAAPVDPLVYARDVAALLATLAAETIRADLLVRLRDEAVDKTADYCEELAGATAGADRLAAVVERVRAKLDTLAAGELAHRSRDYGRGVAQATRDILAALVTEPEHPDGA